LITFPLSSVFFFSAPATPTHNLLHLVSRMIHPRGLGFFLMTFLSRPRSSDRQLFPRCFRRIRCSSFYSSFPGFLSQIKHSPPAWNLLGDHVRTPLSNPSFLLSFFVPFLSRSLPPEELVGFSVPPRTERSLVFTRCAVSARRTESVSVSPPLPDKFYPPFSFPLPSTGRSAIGCSPIPFVGVFFWGRLFQGDTESPGEFPSSFLGLMGM